jgi:anaerobic selenocysteine-containing dehydrogenase
VQIGERDAKALNIKDGDRVIVESRRGQVEVKASVGLMADGQVFIPFHFGYYDSKDGRATAANELTQGEHDDFLSRVFQVSLMLTTVRAMGSGFQAANVQIWRRPNHSYSKPG